MPRSPDINNGEIHWSYQRICTEKRHYKIMVSAPLIMIVIGWWFFLSHFFLHWILFNLKLRMNMAIAQDINPYLFWNFDTLFCVPFKWVEPWEETEFWGFRTFQPPTTITETVYTTHNGTVKLSRPPVINNGEVKGSYRRLCAQKQFIEVMVSAALRVTTKHSQEDSNGGIRVRNVRSYIPTELWPYVFMAVQAGILVQVEPGMGGSIGEANEPNCWSGWLQIDGSKRC